MPESLGTGVQPHFAGSNSSFHEIHSFCQCRLLRAPFKRDTADLANGATEVAYKVFSQTLLHPERKALFDDFHCTQKKETFLIVK